jgi:L,D-peptidoglycan transpeptidase YkuD (ErfK/YbiS/YcfS/YnhG family)
MQLLAPVRQGARSKASASMIFTAHADGLFDLRGAVVRCALGLNGVIEADAKREGDGRSPAGVWPLRQLLYRPDRGPRVPTRLPTRFLTPNDGWCDDPRDRAYNQAVRIPYGAGMERLWREDGVYDLLVVLGYNDDPALAGAGSAIFLHVATPGYSPTQGCIALARPDLETLLAVAGPNDALAISLAPWGR